MQLTYAKSVDDFDLLICDKPITFAFATRSPNPMVKLTPPIARTFVSGNDFDRCIARMKPRAVFGYYPKLNLARFVDLSVATRENESQNYEKVKSQVGFAVG